MFDGFRAVVVTLMNGHIVPGQQPIDRQYLQFFLFFFFFFWNL